MTVLAVSDLKKSYHDGQRELPILSGASVRVGEGEFVGICGPSGCGKSTFLHCIAGLEPYQSGEVRISGLDVGRMTESARARFRNETLGFVFQQFHLLPSLSALENVMVPLLIAGKPRSLARQRSEAILMEVGLEDRLSHRPSALSGGEQQRVAIARALVGQPKLLLADEPTGNLDAANGEAILRLLLQLRATHHMTLLLVTHNMDLMRRCDVRLELKNATLHPMP